MPAANGGGGAGHGLQVFANTSGHENAFYGGEDGRDNTAGYQNAYFGYRAGYRRQGSQNSIFGSYAGWNADTGSYNSFFGHSAGLNSYGDKNSYFGASTGAQVGAGSGNSFFGYHAGVLNTSGSNNVFVGVEAGGLNAAGFNNVFVGAGAGQTNTDGAFNTYVGREADGSASTIGATAVGTGAKANAPHTVVLGGANDKVIIPGSLIVTGAVAKGGGSFKIDHPLDPLSKTLSHSFVESPEMMNVYNGNVTTDARGLAVVRLPEYFEALNRDFRYQLTVLGRFAQAIVLEEVSRNRFVIKTSRPGVKVSWQVTGVRQHAYANAHRVPTAEEKPAAERGTYLYPEPFRRRPDAAPAAAAGN